MYLAHFGLNELPFGLTPDTGFAFSTRTHQEALNTLLVAVDSGEGFTKVTGEVGTGKTLLCRRFLAMLPDSYVSCYLPNPNQTSRSLLFALAEELGRSLMPASDEFALLKAINQTLLLYAQNGRRVVVCVDEAQALPEASLETLRLLSNLETEKRKLLQLVLFGQPELDDKLSMSSLRQLQQRISFHYRLESMSREELRLYLDHRLRVAGHHGPSLFAPSAIAALHNVTAGTPRLVNILAHKSLLTVYGVGGAMVEAKHVREAARDTDSSTQPRFGFVRWLLP